MAGLHQEETRMHSPRVHIAAAALMAWVFFSAAAVARASQPGDQPEDLALSALGGAGSHLGARRPGARRTRAFPG